MMQQMVLQQQTFMQTMAASVQQQQQSFQQQSQTFMQTMEVVYASTNAIAKAASCKFCACTTWGSRISSFGILSDKYSEARVRSPPPPPPRDSQDAERDVFAKSDKWLPSLPVIGLYVMEG